MPRQSVESTQLTESTQILDQTNFTAWNKHVLNFSLTYLSENLSDLFRKQQFWLVHDDIIRKYEHGADNNMVLDVEVISCMQWVRKGWRVCSK